MVSTPQATDSGTKRQRRYLASDFQRLTLPRRNTSPHIPSPDSQYAHEPRSGASGTTSSIDKRAIDARSPRIVAGTSQVSRQSSTSTNSSVGRGTLKQCVAEDNHGTAQSFLECVNASIIPPPEPVKDATRPTSPASPTTSPVFAADTCECCCRCGRNAKWQPLGRGVRKSKSYTALRTSISELSGWDLDAPKSQHPQPAVVKREFGPGEAPLERLPAEVLDDIIAQLALDLPPSSYAPRNVDLIACLLTSKTIHVATINTLYKHITVPHSLIFSKFLNHINEYPGLGTLVRRLDLSHFTSVGLGRSRQLNSEIQNLTAKTLVKCLQLTPAIQEVLLQENLDDDIDSAVLQHLFFKLPKLRAVDFCASSSPSFVDAFASITTSLRASPEQTLAIKRLSLHECFTLPSATFETLLPRLTQLTHLDVSHTRITDKALASIPRSAHLTHLNLGRCSHITGEGVADLLTSHPAVKNLVYLNLSCDIVRYRLLYECDVDRILPALPTTLRSLNLNGAQIVRRHIPRLLPLTRHVEELGLAAAELSLADVNALFSPASSSNTDAQQHRHQQQEQENDDTTTKKASSSERPPLGPATIHYLDLSNIASITQASLFNTPAPTNILLQPATLPLEVLELGDKAISSLRECKNTNKRLGWCVKELGRRGWYVREPVEGTLRDGGRRSWKMGAMWWGMRKCPVAWGEVGGLYGHYMFKK